MTRSTSRLILAAIFAVILAGCGSMAVRPVAGPEKAALYGNIKLPEGNITNVMLYKVGVVYAPPFKSPPKGHVYTNGNFLFENLAPGKYFLVGFMSGRNAFYFNYRGLEKEEFIKEVAIDVKPGSVVYAGSYAVTGIDHNFIKSDTFEIKRTDKPSRKTILRHLAQAAAGTGWDARFEQSIKNKK
jgi:hypothetical protein